MNYVEGLVICDRLMNQLEVQFDLFYNESDVQHLKNVYKQLTNVKGNINTLMKDERHYAHRANKEQLNDGLFKLFNITKSEDPWVEDVRTLTKVLYDWPAINAMLARMYENARKTGQTPPYGTYKTQYGRFMEFHQHTEDEIIELITNYPYLSKIYSGKHSIAISIGAMMI